jgi:DNA-binding NarL/FixJ family response regulator
MTVLIAACLYQAGDKTAAKRELLDALRLGADTGLFRTFVDEMPWIEHCLREVRRSLGAQWAPLNPYVISLLSAAGPNTIKHKKRYVQHGAVDLLSTKEAVILRLISLGLSNKSIARELCIAPETVKSHAKRIFIKLSAKTRAEAVARATDLQLI